MTMTRRDFDIIAQELKDELPFGFEQSPFEFCNLSTREIIVQVVVAALKKTNPHFDRVKFAMASGIEDRKRADFVTDPEGDWNMGVWFVNGHTDEDPARVEV